MIVFLSGILDEKFPDKIYIDVQGVGYLVYIPTSTYDQLPEKGSEIKIWTYFHVREDAHILYGFITSEEVEFFKLLMQTSGVGPKLAINILSAFSVSECQNAILNENAAFLSSAQGVGRKVAQKIIVELKDKIAKILPQGQMDEKIIIEDKVVRDALLALESLGYKLSQAKQAVFKAQKIVVDKNKVEDLVKTALKFM